MSADSLNIIEIIEKKRDNHPLSAEEINFFIDSVTNDKIPDYQISALLMAIYLNGMNDSEISLLTNAMAKSGDRVDLSYIDGIKVDKHSSGGVGDKVSLVAAPMVASCGIPVAKMSGRGLGFSGGTIDKLESIPGFRTALTGEEFINFVKKDKIAITGQTKNVAPADKKLYALRDVTATVASIPLIAASIMSKKLACTTDAIVLDVKCGSGAFMKTFEEAAELARKMVSIGESSGRRVYALITNMDQPLGNAVGNSLEVKEAIETLKGGEPSDFKELCLIVASYMLLAGEKAKDIKSARQMAVNSIESGAALSKFQAFVKNQGGNPEVVNNPRLLPCAKVIKEVKAPETAVVTAINGEKAGAACLTVKAGRMTKTDKIDYSSGFIFHSKVGDKVQKGDVIAEVHAADEAMAEQAAAQILSAYSFGEKAQIKPMLLGYIDKEGLHLDKDKN